jgi:hypothetical protein
MKYTTKATAPMMTKTPSGETLLEACGGETVAQARLVRMSNIYTQSKGAPRKFNEGYNVSTGSLTIGCYHDIQIVVAKE